MKLSQLTEARYAGEHPVIDELKATLRLGLPNPRGDFSTKFWDIESRAVKGIVKSLTDLFGPPRVGQGGEINNDPTIGIPGGGNIYHWEPEFDDKRYGITIGYDNRINPPYGLEVYFIQGPPR